MRFSRRDLERGVNDILKLRLLRFHVGRFLIHAGLRAMPPGRVRTELDQLLRDWGSGVTRELRAAKQFYDANYRGERPGEL